MTLADFERPGTIYFNEERVTFTSKSEYSGNYLFEVVVDGTHIFLTARDVAALSNVFEVIEQSHDESSTCL